MIIRMKLLKVVADLATRLREGWRAEIQSRWGGKTDWQGDQTLWAPECLESFNKSCFPSSLTVPIFKEGNLKPPSLNKVRLTTRLDMVANGIVPCHIDVMMMQVGSHRSEPQRLRAQNIWCRYFSPCSRFQLMVYSWRCSKTWVDYDTDQFGPP